MTVKFYGRDWTFKALDLRWHELEVSIENVAKGQKEREERFHALEQRGHKVNWTSYDIVAAAIEGMIAEQAEIEIFLIENEAPGWTST